jgi:6-pyruvoyltetrahydropterin/6-carboxytetrahydropterin synthase
MTNRRERAAANRTHRAMKLTRTVRLAHRADGTELAPPSPWLSDGWIVPIEIDVAMEGTPDAVTGYILPIQRIDQAVQQAALACPRALAPSEWLVALRTELAPRLPFPIARLTLRPHPLLERSIEATMHDRCILTLRFDFAASHRLHCAALGEEENRRVFGKCNNPAGHGHNYRLEVEVETPLGQASLQPEHVARIVNEHAVDRLDHKHLNTDLPEFRDTNPSVEWIARTCFGWLEAPLATAGGRLHRVRLWETEKTSAIYPG